MTPRADDLSPEEQRRRLEALAHLEDAYRTIMREAKAEFDQLERDGMVVRVAGFVRRCKGKTRKKSA